MKFKIIAIDIKDFFPNKLTKNQKKGARILRERYLTEFIPASDNRKDGTHIKILIDICNIAEKEYNFTESQIRVFIYGENPNLFSIK